MDDGTPGCGCTSLAPPRESGQSYDSIGLDIETLLLGGTSSTAADRRKQKRDGDASGVSTLHGKRLAPFKGSRSRAIVV